MTNTPQQFLPVLLADDDMDDRMLFSDAIGDLKLNIDLQIVRDGVELMDYLLTSALIMPEILFLDLNMPRKNGFECLNEIKNNETLRDIFIIIYSTSENLKEIDEVFLQQANLFVKKPNSFTELKNILSQLFATNLKKEFSHRTKEKFIFQSFPVSKKE